MIKNPESFDNICINSQDSDADIEIKPISRSVNSSKTTSNQKDFSPHFQYSNNKTNNDTNNLQKILVDESSNDSDEVTFIRQISKPLLNTTSSKNRLKRRIHLQYKRKWTKVIGICFISTVMLAIVLSLVFVLLPNNVLKRLYNEIWNRYLHGDHVEIVGCDEISVEDIWMTNHPQMLSEGAVRLVRINDDDVLDVVLPFGTNVQNKIVCKIYYPDQARCFGGLLALDGRTGNMLWRYDANGEMYAAVCLEDLNKDGWIDCLGAGRQGTFAAVSGRDGSELWAFDKNAARNTFMNLYTAQFIEDVDGDGIKDIVQMHGGDPVAQPSEMNRLIAKLVIFSGKTGKLLVSSTVPDNHESYYSPQLLNLGDGVKKILFGTGGETFSGSLFEVDLSEMLNNKIDQKPHKLYQGPRKGVMTPPVLVDLNSDGREDIVLCPFGDECFAIDGVTFKQIWKFNRVKNFETYATPAAGFYNDDDVPDIFVQLFVGLGYPVYFYGETLILDGKTGKLIKNLTRSNNVVISSPLTLSIEGQGNDLFLYWLQLCRGHETDIKEVPFQNLPQYILSRAHNCKIRFNTTTESMFLVHGQHIKNQSISYGQIYNSENTFHFEHAYVNNRTQQIDRFLLENPKYRPIFKQFNRILETTDLSQADPSSSENGDNFHNDLVQQQRRLENIDLNDDSVHGSIDFTQQPQDEMESSSKDYYMDEIPDRKARFVSDSERKLYRVKRHNGPHDGEGLQRLISTGSLAPPMLDTKHPNFNQSMDIIFFTYWSIPKEINLQTKEEMKCNSKWENLEPQRFKNGSKFFYYDHDHYTKYGNIYCAKKYGRKVPLSEKEKEPTVFNNHFGQLTAYRKRLKCTCSPGRVQANQRCSRVLPLHLQSWPAYLGLGGTSYWNSSYYNLKLMKEI